MEFTHVVFIIGATLSYLPIYLALRWLAPRVQRRRSRSPLDAAASARAEFVSCLKEEATARAQNALRLVLKEARTFAQDERSSHFAGFSPGIIEAAESAVSLVTALYPERRTAPAQSAIKCLRVAQPSNLHEVVAALDRAIDGLSLPS